MDVLDTVGPLNQFLCDLHGPTTNIARTMSRLVPFPESIGSLPDADLLDLSVAIDSDVFADNRSVAEVKARARYATSAWSDEVLDFYLDEFRRTAARVNYQRPEAPDRHVLEATLKDSLGTSYRVAIDNLRGYRSVKVTVTYGGFAYQQLFDRFAAWHCGDAPVSAVSEPTGLEITTFASGRRPNTLVLYSTHYGCADTPQAERRAMVNDRLGDLGWTYREPREGIMFMHDGGFDAETHVHGDETSSNVTFVGEFQLR